MGAALYGTTHAMRIKYLIFLLPLLFVLYWIFAPIGEKERDRYNKLNIKALQFQKQEGLSLMTSSEPQRKKVVKELWLGQEKPLYVRIECDHSQLVVVKKKEQFAVVEKMHTMRALLQEELFYLLPDGRTGHIKGGKVLVKEGDAQVSIDPALKTLIPMQEVRYLEAKSGILDYNTLELKADEVTMRRYRLRGHLPPPFAFAHYTPLSEAAGKRATCLFKEGKPKVHLEGLKAIFNPKEKI